MMPEEWKLEALSDAVKIIDCKHRTPKYVDSGIPLVSPGTIKWGALDLNSPVKRVSKSEYQSLMDHCKVDIGDLVMSRNQSLGIASYVQSHEPFVLGQDTVLIKPTTSNIKFIFYKLQSDAVQKSIIKLAGGSTFSRINLADIRKLKVNLPPISQQEKIAQILSTWDMAINTTGRLLANSQQQKKALMQQLLTGKKRLLDENGVRFSGEWNRYKLKDIGNTFSGLTGKSKADFGKGTPYIPYKNIFKNSRIDLSELDYVEMNEGENQTAVKFGDIFFTTSSEVIEEVGMSSVLLDDVEALYLNSFCFGFRLNDFETLTPQFAQHLFRSESSRRKISKLGQGATRYNLSKKQLTTRFEFKVPPINEQIRIASVLSNADNVTAQLSKQLTRLKYEKKALMQQLLTGKHRVKVDKEAA